MNLFNNAALIQAVRQEYDLSIPQAKMMLIAYEWGTVSSLSGKFVLGFENDARRFAMTKALVGPVKAGHLTPVGKCRVQPGTKPSAIYEVADPLRLKQVVVDWQVRQGRLRDLVAGCERTAQNHLDALNDQ